MFAPGDEGEVSEPRGVKDQTAVDAPEPRKVSAVPANKIIALDARPTLEEVYEKGVSPCRVRQDINRQIETSGRQRGEGLRKLFPEAARMLM